jgi:deoxyribonuclease IV
MKIFFGPAGLGGIDEAEDNLKTMKKLGLKACEIAFTYGIYIKKKNAKNIKKWAKKNNIKLSVHAPYWINLNSNDNEKVEKSKKRILKSCEVSELIGAEKVVFHPGYYGKDSKENTYNKIKKEIIELQEEIKRKKWEVKLAPETTGKKNVFGSVEEIKNLVKETGCFFTIDFAHLFARNNGKIALKNLVKDFEGFEELHCHFSGIEYGDKGEKKHKETSEEDIKELLIALKNLKNLKKVVIINESPIPLQDSVLMSKIWKEII